MVLWPKPDHQAHSQFPTELLQLVISSCEVVRQGPQAPPPPFTTYTHTYTQLILQIYGIYLSDRGLKHHHHHAFTTYTHIHVAHTSDIRYMSTQLSQTRLQLSRGIPQLRVTQAIAFYRYHAATSILGYSFLQVPCSYEYLRLQLSIGRYHHSCIRVP